MPYSHPQTEQAIDIIKVNMRDDIDECYEEYLDGSPNSEDNLENFHQECCNGDDDTLSGILIEYCEMNDYNLYIDYINTMYYDICGENISIEILIDKKKLRDNMIYFIGKEWQYDKLNELEEEDNEEEDNEEEDEVNIEDNSDYDEEE